MMQAVQPYISLMRLNKPVGIFLLLWPTLLALCFASAGVPSLRNVIIFSLGVLVMRSAGCVINDFADRGFDAHVTRTKLRPLACKQVTNQAALLLFSGLITLAFILVLQLQTKVILASLLGLALAIFYPFTKRWTQFPQFILGLTFAWSIVMVYLQVQGSCSLETWILFVATTLWVLAYDTIYAMVDKVDDLKIGIKSSAIAFGRFDKIMVLALQSCALSLFAVVGQMRQCGPILYIGILFALANMFYQQWLVQGRDPKQCFAAFLQNNYLGAFVVIGAFVDRMLYYMPQSL